MRAVFATYLLLIVAGLGYFIAIAGQRLYNEEQREHGEPTRCSPSS